MLPKFLSHFLLIFLLVFLETDKIFAQENALLWEISKENYHTSYLFGTMHIKNPRVFAFNDSTLIYLQQCDAYAGELIINENDYSKYIMEIFEKDASKQCRNVLNHEELNSVNLYLKEKEIKELLLLVPFMSPYMVALMSILNEQESETNDSLLLQDKFLDLYLQSYADSLGHQLISLETFDDQLSYIKNIDINEQKDYLLKLVNNQLTDSMKMDDFISIYESEQLDELYALLMSNNDNDPLISKSFIEDRNWIQMNSLIQAMKKRKTFAAVGAAHLVGNKGLIFMLRDNGFTVRPVYKQF